MILLIKLVYVKRKGILINKINSVNCVLKDVKNANKLMFVKFVMIRMILRRMIRINVYVRMVSI